jgi:hypothetical protein
VCNIFDIVRHVPTLFAILCAVALLGASSSAGAPITKQNGSTPVFADFTSICGVAGYLNYGLCDGNATKFTNIKGRVNAVQSKLGRWNLGLSFTGLQPGATYRLWGNQDGATPSPGVIDGFFIIGTGLADAYGNLRFSYQTDKPNNLGFDLNALPDAWMYSGITLVTSYWSQQAIKVLDANGNLYVPGS